MAKADRLQMEQEHHQRAFELYRSLGAKRSYGRVAAQIGVSASAVKLWARSFNWRPRLCEGEAETARQMAEKALQTSMSEGQKQRRIVQMALVRLARGIAEGQIKMQMGDLDRLIRLQAFIDGLRGKQPGEYTAAEITAILNAADDSVLDEIIREPDEESRFPEPKGTE